MRLPRRTGGRLLGPRGREPCETRDPNGRPSVAAIVVPPPRRPWQKLYRSSGKGLARPGSPPVGIPRRSDPVFPQVKRFGNNSVPPLWRNGGESAPPPTLP
ncbi:hypothetical protein ADLECEL_12270 [Adlercreutzia equolifaciens subsp. celatus]|nr:hypothetical protein ADLECEL_12270 [Adlercreutzia equolifaciens subsp. celatus]